MGLDINWAVDWVRRSADVVSEHRVELINLDREPTGPPEPHRATC